MWVHGGDRNPFVVEAEVRAIARGIRESGAPQMHTAHWASGTSGLDHLADVLDFNTSYTYGPVAWRVLHDRARHGERPTILVETHYENDFGKRTAEDVRAYPYRAMLSGAAGHLFGNKPLWYCGRGWETALALARLALHGDRAAASSTRSGGGSSSRTSRTTSSSRAAATRAATTARRSPSPAAAMCSSRTCRPGSR